LFLTSVSFRDFGFFLFLFSLAFPFFFKKKIKKK